MDILIGILSSIIAALILDFVIVKFYNYMTGADRDIFWRSRSKTLSEIDPKHSLDVLKRRLKILVIDDEDIFPITPFQEAGYNIERWEKVKNYNQLEQGDFDIIILDIIGVAEHISDDDGLGILESLKSSNPTQIIVAYSMHEFDLSKQRFFRLADDTIKKPTKFTSIKDKIDKLIVEKFSSSYPVSILRKLMIENNINEGMIKKFENKLSRFHHYGTEPNWNELLRFIDDPNVLRQVKSTAIRILKNIK